MGEVKLTETDIWERYYLLKQMGKVKPNNHQEEVHTLIWEKLKNAPNFKICLTQGPVYLSFDIDAIDPGFCPGNPLSPQSFANFGQLWNFPFRDRNSWDWWTHIYPGATKCPFHCHWQFSSHKHDVTCNIGVILSYWQASERCLNECKVADKVENGISLSQVFTNLPSSLFYFLFIWRLP